MDEKLLSKVSFERVVNVYKCIVLTVIAVLLFLILVKVPILPPPEIPVTLKAIRDKSVSPQDVPVVYVRDGSITVDGSVQVDGGYITIDN
jgi:hypothetical protein